MTLYRFDMVGAQQSGERRHPETVIREWFPLAVELEPESIADCWMFRADKREAVPSFFVDVDAELVGRPVGQIEPITIEVTPWGSDLSELNWKSEP